MRQLNRSLLILILIFGLGITAQAQEGMQVVYQNENSVNAIPYYEQLYKQRTWTRVDLAQKQNKGFFSKNREFTKVLIDAVLNDEIQIVYDAEPGLFELEKPMTKEEFTKRLMKSDPEDQVAELQPLYEIDFPYNTGEIVESDGVNYTSLQDNNLENNPASNPDWWELWAGEVSEPYMASEITIIEVMEDVIFDKRRARQYNDIQSIRLIVSGEYTNDATNYYVATFAYRDLEKFFREHPEKAIWYNQYNSAENRNLADAFLLRLFHGDLYKVDNPEDLTIQDIYGTNSKTGEPSVKAGLIGAEYLRMKMLEREHNLWSY
jgi:gliding motility associated protien GldN